MPKAKARLLWQLFSTTFKIGAITFGGGYAMVPLLQAEFVEKHRWLEPQEATDAIAVCNSLPGVISVNTCVFTGYKMAKVAGAVAAGLGVVLPAFIIMTIASYAYDFLAENKNVLPVLMGIRAGVIALLANAAFKMAKPTVSNAWGIILGITGFIAVAVFNINAVLVLAIGAVLGLIIRGVQRKCLKH